MQFACYYDVKRFRYLHHDLSTSDRFRLIGPERLKKTASFYGDIMNVYIDTSDGVNEDLPINEYCGRILNIINETNGKPFLYFKAAYSPTRSADIVKIAEENNGKVIPFFKWSFNDDFYSYLVPNRDLIAGVGRSAKKEFDVGVFASLRSYTYPKPNSSNPLVSWQDGKKFGIGSNEDTGFFTLNTRKDLSNHIENSEFSLLYKEKIEYNNYIENSFKCNVVLNTPGIGEYTSRMFDQSFLGNCLVLRKTDYDFGLSWKNSIPEIDFNKESWESELQEIIDNRKEWADRCREYFVNSWSSNSIVGYLSDKIDENI